MTEQAVRRGSLAGLSLGYVLIALAVAILMGWWLGDWWYFLFVLMLEVGAYIMLLGAWTGRGGTKEGRSNFVFMLLWGGILMVLGAELIVNDLYPDNGVFLVVIFIVFIAIIALFAWTLGRKK